MKKIIITLVSAAAALSFIKLFGGRANNEKEVEITLEDWEGVCAVSDVDPPTRTLKKLKHKVRWVVKNNCSRAVTVTVGGFSSEDPLDPGKTKPFGPEASDNRFDFETIEPGDESRLISKKGKGESPAQPEETYKYDITVRWGEAAGDEYRLDPRVRLTN
ncbi:MAG TPA: hypothetical protein VIG62_15130 [Blastocatellia bacterium]|jgi:hypothetical protein